MRWVLIFFALVFLVVAGYAYTLYSGNPAACQKLERDVVALFHSGPAVTEAESPAAATNATNAPVANPGPITRLKATVTNLGAAANLSAATNAAPEAEPAPMASAPVTPATVQPAPVNPGPGVPAPVTAAPAAPPQATPSLATPAPVPSVTEIKLANASVPAPCPPPSSWTEMPSAPPTNVVAAPAAPATNAAPVDEMKPWAPPAVLPAQPHWEWTVSDGNVYEDVVVTKIEPDTVSITHAKGAAHVAMVLLPAEIQKRLNYDPKAAAAAKAETEREAAHPYYPVASLTEAKTAARQLHRPLAWICSFLPGLSNPSPLPGSDDDLTQMAVNALKPEAVVVFLDGNADLGKVPPMVLDQFYQFDDGPMPGAHHFYSPKIVFSDADVTRTLGRVSHTELKASGTAPITSALEAIAAEAPAPAPPNPAPTNAPAAALPATGSP